MTTTYSGANAFPTSITLPADGEAPVVASVNVPMEGLADRTTYLKARTDAIDGLTFRTLKRPEIKDSGGVSLDFSIIRLDGSGSCPPFWSPSYNLWLKPGINSAGHVYIGDNGYYANFNTGATAPPTTSFGCDSAIQDTSPGRVCLFSAASVASNPAYILGPASGDYDSASWTTKVLDANAYATFVRANDCAVTPAQTVIVVGGGDISGFGQFLVWRSTDFGNSFTRIVVDNAALFGDFFTRVIVGKSGMLLAWIKDGAADKGDRLYYSTDDGATWSNRAGIGFDNIVDGVYLPDIDTYFFSSGSAIYSATDPIGGSFTAHAAGSAVLALGGFGHTLVYGTSPTALRPELRASVDALATTKLVGRDPTTRQAFRSIVANPLGQLCIATAGSLVLTGRL